MTNFEYSSKGTKFRSAVVGIGIIAVIVVGIWLSLPDIEDVPDELPPLPFIPQQTVVPPHVGTIAPDDRVSGTLSSQPDANVWTFTTEKDQTVNIGLHAEFFTTLQLVDSDGNLMAAASEGVGIAEAVLCNVTLPESGEYSIIVGSLQGGGDYQLELFAVSSAGSAEAGSFCNDQSQ